MGQTDKILRETSPNFNILMDMTPAAEYDAHIIVSAADKPLQTKRRVNGSPVNPGREFFQWYFWCFLVLQFLSDRMTAGCVQNLMQAFRIVFPKLHF